MPLDIEDAKSQFVKKVSLSYTDDPDDAREEAQKQISAVKDAYESEDDQRQILRKVAGRMRERLEFGIAGQNANSEIAALQEVEKASQSFQAVNGD